MSPGPLAGKAEWVGRGPGGLALPFEGTRVVQDSKGAPSASEGLLRNLGVPGNRTQVSQAHGHQIWQEGGSQKGKEK